jgi:hypothetical protein
VEIKSGFDKKIFIASYLMAAQIKENKNNLTHNEKSGKI